jgi:hypothetical protein
MRIGYHVNMSVSEPQKLRNVGHYIFLEISDTNENYREHTIERHIPSLYFIYKTKYKQE